MSLKDDLDALERHIQNGTGEEYLKGTAPALPLPTRLPSENNS